MIINEVPDRFTLPIVGDIASPFVFHFDFTAPDGSIVLSAVRKRSLRDQYNVELPASPRGLAAGLAGRRRDGRGPGRAAGPLILGDILIRSGRARRLLAQFFYWQDLPLPG